MDFIYDAFERLETPRVFLTSQDKTDKLELRVHNLRASLKLIDISEISFSINEYEDDMKNAAYDLIEGLRTILVDGVGYFQLKQPEIVKDGFRTTKNCTAKSLEYQLKQKKLNYFIINMGTVGSINNVSLYNPTDTSKSLMHLALSTLPNWSVGEVDVEIMDDQRSFDIDSQDIYSFFMNDASKAFQCVFTFDTVLNKVNAKYVPNLGKDTDIHVSLKNLAKSINITSDEDAIITKYYIEGYDGLDIRDANLGSDYIEDLSYFNAPEWFGSEALCTKYTAYVAKIESNRALYISKRQAYQAQDDIITELHNRLPSNADSITWSEYGLDELGVQKTSYENIIAAQIEGGQNVSTHLKYESYLENVSTLADISAEYTVRNGEVTTATATRDGINAEIIAILNDVKEVNNFTAAEIAILSTFKIHADYSDEAFVATESMDDAAVLQVKQDLLASAKEELSKSCQPQYYFKTELCNLFAMPEFADVSADFEVGNFITLSIREDYHVRLRVVSLEISFDDSSSITVEFSNLVKSRKKTNDFMYLLNNTVTASTNSISRDISEKQSAIEDIIADYVSKEDLEKDYLSIKELKINYVNNADIITASNKITGNLGGYKVDLLNAEGKPYETLYMDTDNITTATNVLRINQQGIGFSQSGYTGVYGTAITIDGKIVADYITTGTLSASLIKAGILKSYNNYSWINMEDGTFSFGDAFSNVLNPDGSRTFTMNLGSVLSDTGKSIASTITDAASSAETSAKSYADGVGATVSSQITANNSSFTAAFKAIGAGEFGADGVRTGIIKMDIGGITVDQTDENGTSTGQTVISNTEFAGYYQNQKVFWLNKDEVTARRLKAENGADFNSIKALPVTLNEGTADQVKALVFVKSGGAS